jgi:hypothetical protein
MTGKEQDQQFRGRPMKAGTSKKKIEANRANAQHSTGPKSQLGKSKSKKNSTKHGVYATNTLLPGEDEALYEAIRNEQRKLFQPRTFIEKALIDQLVGELWTLKRIARAEHLHLMETRKSLLSSPIKLSDDEKVFMEEAASVVGDEATKDQRKMLAKVTKKVTKDRLEETYESLFVFDPNGRTQRLALLKRHVLQTILSIERDLDRRLALRDVQ